MMAWAEPTAAKIDETSTEICCSGDHPQAALFLLSLIVRPPHAQLHIALAVVLSAVHSYPVDPTVRCSETATVVHWRRHAIFSGLDPMQAVRAKGPGQGGCKQANNFTLGRRNR